MPDPKVDTHVLLSRLPCVPLRATFDLHVLGMPPALILSQDQTLKKRDFEIKRKKNWIHALSDYFPVVKVIRLVKLSIKKTPP